MNLTQESLEDVMRGIVALCDSRGVAIAIQPKSLIIKPETVRQLSILHACTEEEMLERIKRIAIDAYNAYPPEKA